MNHTIDHLRRPRLGRAAAAALAVIALLVLGQLSVNTVAALAVHAGQRYHCPL